MDMDLVYAAWERWYKAHKEDPGMEDQDFESICIGFCAALGVDTADAFDMYKEMIKRGYF